MGISMTTATYEKGDISADVSLTGSGGGSGLGALGSLASMGMMQSGRQVRVAGLPEE